MKRFVMVLAMVFGVMVGQAFGQNLDLLTKEEQAEAKTSGERFTELLITMDWVERTKFLDYYTDPDETDEQYIKIKGILLEMDRLARRMDRLMRKAGVTDTKVQPLLTQIAVDQVILETSYLNAKLRMGY